MSYQIAGRVTIDLSADLDTFDPGYDDRRRLDVLHRCPDGVEVVIQLGQRQYLTEGAVQWIHEHGDRLRITIEGPFPDTLMDIVRATRAGHLGAA